MGINELFNDLTCPTTARPNERRFAKISLNLINKHKQSRTTSRHAKHGSEHTNRQLANRIFTKKKAAPEIFSETALI
jgi:hypothetical protein